MDQPFCEVHHIQCNERSEIRILISFAIRKEHMSPGIVRTGNEAKKVVAWTQTLLWIIPE
jgi:hypothetical protein